MKRITLENLILESFAGVRQFSLTPAGESITVRGANGSGKTTLHNAYNWLLFNKDGQGRAKFDIIELDDQGNEVTMQDATVTGVFTVDGRRVELRKVYKQKWAKPRGQAEQVFSGHETLHFVDDVPLSKGEFEKRVAEFASEDTWKLVSDPRAFSDLLHWKERRTALLEIVGGISNSEVLDAHPEFSSLLAEMGERDAEDYRKVLTARRKSLNDELIAIPVRVDEARRSIASVDLAAAGAAVAVARAELAAATVSSRNDELVALSSRINDLRFKADEKAAAVNRERQARHRDLTGRLSDARGQVARLERTVKNRTTEVDTLTEQINALKLEWQTLRHAELNDEACAACGQVLPDGAEKAATRRAEALKRVDAKAEVLTGEKAAAVEALEAAQAVLVEVTALAGRLEAELAAVDVTPVEPVYPPELAELQAEYDAAKANEGPQEALRAAQERLDNALGVVAAAKASEAAQARVSDLTAREREVSQQLEDAERDLHLIESFIRARAKMLEGKVNNLFPTVRFKLFNELVNGGLEETCEATIDGVPFASLNTASQVHAGIEIINALHDHAGIIAPVVIDGRESITRIPETPAQVINLMVDANATTLAVE